jgi:hypothetical protein
MNESPRVAPAGRGIPKIVVILATASIIALAIYLTRTTGFTPDDVMADEVRAWRAAPPPEAAAEAANSFLDALEAKQKEQAALEFGSAKKSNWSNLPTTVVRRNGIRMGDLTKEQRSKAMAVVAAVLSKEGYQKVLDIMEGDQKLAEQEGKDGGKGGKGKDGGKGGKGGGALFGAAEYYLAIFGTPSETKPWMAQFGGHHLGVNVTVIGKHFVLTPTHTGAQPALYKRDGKDVRPLGPEADTAFKLLTSLDEKQHGQAVIGDRTQNLVLGPGQDGRTVEPKGVKGSALTADQQKLLLDVIATWINIGEPASAATRLAEIKEKLGDTYFAWSGPTEKAGTGYFRVQGPTVVIEYAPQGGTDHVHTVIRNPKDDYGTESVKPEMPKP